MITDGDMHLQQSERGLELVCGEQTIRGDFEDMLPRLKPGNMQCEMLVKAARIKGMEHPKLLDATAGMGEDSLILAAAGFEVTMYEYNPVIAALLRDALTRAAGNPTLAECVAHMRLIEGDSIESMRRLAARADEETGAAGDSDITVVPDVILLDPMFPTRQKSALVKKKFQVLHNVEQPCVNEEDMLMAAIGLKPKKIIIKRPVKGPYLAGIKPSYSLAGKAVRYDCIINM